MKKRLLLFLSRYGEPGNVPIAATLAWLAESQGFLFDSYYDSHHLGEHFGGGDPRAMELGRLTGGSVCADRHIEELYFLLQSFDVRVVSRGDTLFFSTLRNFDIPFLSRSHRLIDIYRSVFDFFQTPLPENVVMLGSEFDPRLAGLDSLLFPEVFHRKALGVPDSITPDDLAELCENGSRVRCACVRSEVVERLEKNGYTVEVVDKLREGDDYAGVSARSAERWRDKTSGWMLGDPVLVTHWLPMACEENLTPIYGIPQEKIISLLAEDFSGKGRVVFGRQYNDSDFFALSALGQSLQVIDPCRPPFQSVRHAGYEWHSENLGRDFFEPEFTDAELMQFAREGRILISLMFWSGMIREIANLYNLMDLFAITNLRSGLVLTAQSFEYMMHGPLELLTVPLDRGGVFPLVEPVLGSCGLGVGIEAEMSPERLAEDLRESLSRILEKVKDPALLPQGWWPTMDADLEQLSFFQRSKFVRFMRHYPHIQFRYHPLPQSTGSNLEPNDGLNSSGFKAGLVDRIGAGVEKAGLLQHFLPFRPYEFFRAGPLKNDILEAVKSCGLSYMFSKSGFGPSPKILSIDEDFIALNYTAGRWDGWTPFETVNDVSDLKKAERVISRKRRPGWIVSTIDSCLWAFGGEFWKNGGRLYSIAEFCAGGGDSGRLINVRPHTISRYARIMNESSRI